MTIAEANGWLRTNSPHPSPQPRRTASSAGPGIGYRLSELLPAARSVCLPGQRRWHFVHQRDSRRRQIIDALMTSGRVTD
jgi:hypothetical protein